MNIERYSEEYYKLPVHKRHLLDKKEHQNIHEGLGFYREIEHYQEQIKYATSEIERIYRVHGINPEKGENIRADKFCVECGSRQKPIYNSEIVHFIDGNCHNTEHGNIAIICPQCESHILMSQFTSNDVFKLKMKGLSNAEIGRYLGLSRERVRQLIKKCEPDSVIMTTVSIDQLIKEEQELERKYRAYRRVTDRRTLKKRITARLEKKIMNYKIIP